MIVAAAWALTLVVVTVNVPDCDPAGMVNELGTVAATLFELKARAYPPVGAGPFTVTVATDFPPPVSPAGLRVRLETDGGMTVSATPTETEPYVAVIFGCVCCATGVVCTVKVAADDPAAITTEEGTVAVLRLLVSPTVSPPAGAAPRITTVPVDEAPPTTVFGLNETPYMEIGLIVSLSAMEEEPNFAVIDATSLVLTTSVGIENRTVVAPADMGMLAGTFASRLLLETATLSPPVGAGPESVIVPLEFVPPPTLVGSRVNPAKPTGFRMRVPLTDPASGFVVAAVTFTVVAALTLGEFMRKAWRDEPSGIRTELGPPHDPKLEVRPTVTPPLGAIPFSVTPPAPVFPPTNGEGRKAIESRLGG